MTCGSAQLRRFAVGLVRHEDTPLEDRAAVRPAVSVAIALLGVLLVVVSTMRYGAGIGPDGVSYVSTARNLLESGAFARYDGTPFVYWPPLFPLLLAAVGALGIDPLDSGRFINAAVFGLTVYCAGRILARNLRCRDVVVLGTVAILLSNPLYGHATMVLSDPLFVLLTILFYGSMLRTLQSQKTAPLAAAICWAALCCLQRYIGAAVVLSGGLMILLLSTEPSIRRRVFRAGVFCCAAVLPVASWMLRNLYISGTLSGQRYTGHTATPLETLSRMLETCSSWLIPEVVSLGPRLGLIALGLAGWMGAAVILRRRGPVQRRADHLVLRSAALFVASFATTLVVLAMTFDLDDRMDNRMMMPAYFFLALMMLTLVDRVVHALQMQRRERGVLLAVGVCMLWLTYPAARISLRAWHRVQHGAGGYHTVTWRESPLMGALRNQPLEGRVYSNFPDAIYILNGGQAAWGPSRLEGVQPFEKHVERRRDNYMVVFQRGRNRFYHPNELQQHFAVQRIAAFADGGIYRFEPLGEPLPPPDPAAHSTVK